MILSTNPTALAIPMVLSQFPNPISCELQGFLGTQSTGCFLPCGVGCPWGEMALLVQDHTACKSLSPTQAVPAGVLSHFSRSDKTQTHIEPNFTAKSKN